MGMFMLVRSGCGDVQSDCLFRIKCLDPGVCFALPRISTFQVQELDTYPVNGGWNV